MTRIRSVLIAAVLLSAVGACSRETPVSPTPGGAASGATVPQIQVRCPEFGESSRCTAFAFTDVGGHDITGLATWSSGDPAIASITSTGLVTAHSTGEVAIRASYQGGSGFLAVWAVPGQGLHGTWRALEGQVLSMNGPLADVVMEILNGPNVGRKTITSSSGRFSVTGLLDGPFTIRLSKAGYVTAEYRWSIPGGKERIPTLTAAP
jgi:hypothetical protein